MPKIKSWQKSNHDKIKIVTKVKWGQSSNCDKYTNVTILKLQQNSNGDKTKNVKKMQMLIKLEFWQNWNCEEQTKTVTKQWDKTQTVTNTKI